MSQELSYEQALELLDQKLKALEDECVKATFFEIGQPAGWHPEITKQVIDAGMTLIVHPNTYHPVVGYMVLGDSLVVTHSGCEVVTATPRELFSVPV